MIRRNVQVPMYQARIPISGGGGHIDLRERAGDNPITAALQQIIQQKRQPKQPTMKIVVGNGKTWLVNPATGEKRDLGIAPPKSKVGDRKISDIINEMAKMSDLEDKELLTRFEPEILDTRKTALRNELAERIGFRFPPPTEFLRTQELPAMRRELAEAQPRRKRVVSKEVKKRPPKPKEYPDAVWNEEHRMWTIVRNNRLKGVK